MELKVIIKGELKVTGYFFRYLLIKSGFSKFSLNDELITLEYKDFKYSDIKDYYRYEVDKII